MADSDRTYTQHEFEALCADAVSRANADLTAEKAALETQVADLTGRVNVLEAEKATLEANLEAKTQEFATYKGDIERAAAVEKAKTERVAAVKAANDKLPDAFFTEERIKSWAEMSEDVFGVVLDGIKATAGAPGTRETAAFRGGEPIGGNGREKQPSVAGSYLAAARGGIN